METGNTANNKTSEAKKNSTQNAGARQDTEESVVAAHDQAEADMEQDPDLNSEPDPSADLDEGEIARLDNGNDGNPGI
jgi:hypothetical protein